MTPKSRNPVTVFARTASIRTVTCTVCTVWQFGDCGPSPVAEDWSAWQDCPVTCGGGKQNRTRDVAVPATNGGKECVGMLGSSKPFFQYMHCDNRTCSSFRCSDASLFDD